MYSVVLMVAATSGGDMASFGGKDKGGCHGTVASASCSGGGFLGLRDKAGCSGGGFLGLRDGNGCNGGLFSGHKAHKGGCHGATHATGCSGAAAPAPVIVAAPAGCSGHAAPAGCHGDRSGFLGLRGNGCGGGGLFGKHKGGCH